ncbi:uncharacterized protein LOC117182149 [Belonocnema kinseyi]|uniref:uncharacterized protein LOC117182149 n=1 Tax=Belonocnema kinseyi TaxID=2817044 RepID=UPI00143CED09|nr:uncharacterized protein LOC117182149 [Belonocnema kinseyi]
MRRHAVLLTTPPCGQLSCAMYAPLLSVSCAQRASRVQAQFAGYVQARIAANILILKDNLRFFTQKICQLTLFYITTYGKEGWKKYGIHCLMLANRFEKEDLNGELHLLK